MSDHDNLDNANAAIAALEAALASEKSRISELEEYINKYCAPNLAEYARRLEAKIESITRPVEDAELAEAMAWVDSLDPDGTWVRNIKTIVRAYRSLLASTREKDEKLAEWEKAFGVKALSEAIAKLKDEKSKCGGANCYWHHVAPCEGRITR